MEDKIYIVSYSFREKKGDYTSLYKELSNFESWWHIMDDTWFVYTDLKTATDVFKKLSPYLDNNIYLVVNELNDNFSGYLPNSGWEWLKKYKTVKHL